MQPAVSLARSPHGTTTAGAPVELVTLATRSGCELRVSTFGAAIVSLTLGGVEVAPCHAEVRALEARAGNPYLGATVGRVAGRTGGARVRGLAEGDADLARLAANDGANTLHGGVAGFDARVWRVESVLSHAVEEGGGGGGGGGAFASVTLALDSPNGDEGFPGALQARVVYSLSEEAAAAEEEGGRPGSEEGGAGQRRRAQLGIEWRAQLAPGQPRGLVTPVALTNHCYWALQGAPAGGPGALAAGAALGLELQLSCARLQPLRESDWLPAAPGATAPAADVTGAGGAGERGARGALDFSSTALLGDRIAALNDGARDELARGFNAYLLVDGWSPPRSLHPLPEAAAGAARPHPLALESALRPCARLRDPASGREMVVRTTCPGVQLYTNFGYAPMPPASTVCLETQHPADTANTDLDAGGGVIIARSLLRAACACELCGAAEGAPPEARHDLTVHDFAWQA